MGIINFSKQTLNKSYLSISVLGKSLKLNIKYIKNNTGIELIKKDLEIDLLLPIKYKNLNNMEIINSAIMKLYSKIAYTEIENSLELARHIFKFAPEDYKIEKLNGVFYKIQKNKVIVISPDIMQFNQNIINTTILQAFCKMKYKPNSKAYKEALENALNQYEKYKKKNTISKKALKVG